MNNEPIDTGIQIEYINERDAYFYLFNFLYDEYNITLLNQEMDDLIKAVDHFKKIFDGKETNNSNS